MNINGISIDELSKESKVEFTKLISEVGLVGILYQCYLTSIDRAIQCLECSKDTSKYEVDYRYDKWIAEVSSHTSCAISILDAIHNIGDLP